MFQASTYDVDRHVSKVPGATLSRRRVPIVHRRGLKVGCISIENTTTVGLANRWGSWQPAVVAATFWPSQMDARWHSGGCIRNSVPKLSVCAGLAFRRPLKWQHENNLTNRCQGAGIPDWIERRPLKCLRGAET